MSDRDTNDEVQPHSRSAKQAEAEQPPQRPASVLALPTNTAAPPLTPLLTNLLRCNLGLTTPPPVVPISTALTEALLLCSTNEEREVSAQRHIRKNEDPSQSLSVAAITAAWQGRLKELRRNQQQQEALLSSMLARNIQVRQLSSVMGDMTKTGSSASVVNYDAVLQEQLLSWDAQMTPTNETGGKNEGQHRPTNGDGILTMAPESSATNTSDEIVRQNSTSHQPRGGGTRGSPLLLEAQRDGDASGCAAIEDDATSLPCFKRKKDFITACSAPSSKGSTDETSDQQVVYELGKHDFLVGKGGHVRQHPGNRRVRNLVLQLLPVYRRATNGRTKARIVDRVIKNTHAHGGRFLEKTTRKAQDATSNTSCLPEQDAARPRKRRYGDNCGGQGSLTIGWKVVAPSDCRQRLSQRFREEMSGRPQTWRQPPNKKFRIRTGWR